MACTQTPAVTWLSSAGNIQFYGDVTETASQLTLNQGLKGVSVLQAIAF